MNSKVFGSLGALVLFALSVNAQAPEDPWKIFAGYKYLYFDKITFIHDTHPGDRFLPNAEVPGSAGTTELQGALHFATVGVGYQPRISERISLSFDLGVLIGGGDQDDDKSGLRDERINANEVRPDDGHYRPSFIYSKVVNVGGIVSVDMLYHIKGLYLGAEAQLAGVWSNYGWYRYYYHYSTDDNDRFYHYDEQVKKRNFHPIPSPGLKVGYRYSDFYLEGAVQFGRTTTFGIQIGGYIGKWK